jgi:hypothetical protein
MNGFVRKMCILKQLKSGFSADGSPVGGVARVETFAGSLTLQISLINFAPLAEGRYVCVLCDKAGERVIFPLTLGISEYKTKSAFDAEKGFCCLVCFLKTSAECLAAGQYGGGTYRLKLLLEGLLPEERAPMPALKPLPEKQIVYEKAEGKEEKYNDEIISEENYYNQPKRERAVASAMENGTSDGETQKTEGVEAVPHEDPAPDAHPFKVSDGQSFYWSVKDELEELFTNGERTEVFKKALPHSEWVKVKDGNGCLLGQVYENLQVRYIAYALPATTKELPEGMEKACYIPTDPVHPSKGYYVLFQDAATGECVQVFQS